MNKEEIDYGLAIEDLHKPNGLRELAKIQLDKMVENSREQYIKSLQQENKQLKENWNNLKKEIRFARKVSLPVSPYAVGQLDILIHKMNCMESE